MFYAPLGVRVVVRKAASHTNPGANVTKYLRPPAPHVGTRGFATGRIPLPNTSHKLFTYSRNLISRLFTLLTAPGLRAPLSPSLSAGRAIHSTITHAKLGKAAIKQGFSLPVRTALSRPLGTGSFFPRPPAPAVRVSTNMGLGAVRTFTSARPLFQNLVENVPVAMRALYEVDIHGPKFDGHQYRRKTALSALRTQVSSKELLKPKYQTMKPTNVSKDSTSSFEEDLEHYFPAPSVPLVTTYLLVPLAPTPTSRMPLPRSSSATHSGAPSLLSPFEELGALHISHELHSLRVSSLFARLDHGDVWSKGVHCSAFAHHSGQTIDNEGACTILKLEFVGWNIEQVKSVIGECGTGWCVLHEEHKDDLGDSSSDMSSECLDLCAESEESNMYDPFNNPTQSLMMPMLEVPHNNNSFVEDDGASPPLFLSSTLDLSYNAEPNPWGTASSGETLDGVNAVSESGSWVFQSEQSDSGWMGLSSQFLDRAQL
ncbi:hypothetical protein AMATHDRAFT_2204 [Amanita thiersii Skay4041]|uniref:Uncharacterized protein n=1 Tax=Amanita thiersii Skay4041 TaxID=703135 RepID=A0A2A9NND0_9AGAR|nr:hypothetical protein AMATHDRAFT_2204 [Amanita thiersii Skay4041]